MSMRSLLSTLFQHEVKLIRTVHVFTRNEVKWTTEFRQCKEKKKKPVEEKSVSPPDDKDNKGFHSVTQNSLYLPSERKNIQV